MEQSKQESNITKKEIVTFPYGASLGASYRVYNP